MEKITLTPPAIIDCRPLFAFDRKEPMAYIARTKHRYKNHKE